MNSGSEANDLAALLARVSTGHFELLSLQNCYHGMSPFTIGLTSHATWKHALPGASNGIHHVKNPDPYNGVWGGVNCRSSPIQTNRNCDCEPNGECEASTRYFKDLEDVFKYSLPIGKCAGMFAESIQGVGGSVQFPKGYLKRAAELVRNNGGVFISDEVNNEEEIKDLSVRIAFDDISRFKRASAALATISGALNRMTSFPIL